MPRTKLLPLTQKQKLQQSRQRRMGIRYASGVRMDAATRSWYTKQMLEYIKDMNADIENTLVKGLERKEIEYVRDSFVSDFEDMLNLLEARWNISDQMASTLSNQFVGRVDKTDKSRLAKSIGGALGVDVANIVQSEGLSNAIEAAISENVNLITSIPQQHLFKIRGIVMRETVQGRTATSIIDQIRGVYDVTENRARLIARDQTNKINGALTRERQMASGVRAFRWRTVGDEAVREEHRRRNGKVYAWKREFVGQKLADGTVLLDPNADGIGYPGEPIQCRCIAEPIIELDRI